MTTREISRHVYIFNPEDNGGEQLDLVTRFMDNGDKGDEGIWCMHELSLNSYGNVATLTLGIQITPDKLRELANELESEMIKVKHLKEKNDRKDTK